MDLKVVYNDILKKDFKYIYKKVFSKEYVFTEKDLNQLKNFCLVLAFEYGESVGEEWFFKYLLFQFNKYSSAETKIKTLQMSWVFSKKALEKYRERHEDSDYFDEQFAEKFNINKSRLIVYKEQPLSEEYFENERNRFKDRDRQLIHCFEMKLFSDKSSICNFCKNKDYCLKL